MRFDKRDAIILKIPELDTKRDGVASAASLSLLTVLGLCFDHSRVRHRPGVWPQRLFTSVPQWPRGGATVDAVTLCGDRVRKQL